GRIDNAAWGKALVTEFAKVPVADRPFIRFFSFTHLFNQAKKQSEVDEYYFAITKLLNSLSQNPQVLIPTEVPGLKKTVFMVDIRGLAWSQDQWKKVEALYPYFVPTQDMLKLRKASGVKVPVVNGDWFLKFASIEPLYGILLDHPKNSNELEARLGVNRLDDVKRLRVARAGFVQSGVSSNNRVIDRHSIPGSQLQAYWISYDFADGLNKKDIMENPLGPVGISSNHAFEHDGGEIIYHLPNGFFGYMLVDNRGNTLRDAPISIVSDEDPRRPVISNGVSCFTCHGNGLVRKFDTVLSNSFGANTFSPTEIEQLSRLYVKQDKLELLFANDNKIYQTALAEAKIPERRPEDEFISKQTFRFDELMTLDMAAETLGIEPDRLKTLVTNDPGLKILKAQLLGAGLPRPKYIQFYPELLKALGLVEPTPTPAPTPVPTPSPTPPPKPDCRCRCKTSAYTKRVGWLDTYFPPAGSPTTDDFKKDCAAKGGLIAYIGVSSGSSCRFLACHTKEEVEREISS
ncbi:MAG: hypothetical protein AAB250_16160, partial [Bdellovibrionota bacterium]